MNVLFVAAAELVNLRESPPLDFQTSELSHTHTGTNTLSPALADTYSATHKFHRELLLFVYGRRRPRALPARFAYLVHRCCRCCRCCCGRTGATGATGAPPPPPPEIIKNAATQSGVQCCSTPKSPNMCVRVTHLPKRSSAAATRSSSSSYKCCPTVERRRRLSPTSGPCRRRRRVTSCARAERARDRRTRRTRTICTVVCHRLAIGQLCRASIVID